MKKKSTIDKVKFEKEFVKVVLGIDARLTYKHFNNRRYYFKYRSDHDDISVHVVLRVHLENKFIALMVNSKSKLKEITVDKNTYGIKDAFLNRKSNNEFQFESTYRKALENVSKLIQQSMLETIDNHIDEILLSRKGIKLGIDYDLRMPNIPSTFPWLYDPNINFSRTSKEFKVLYNYLYKALKLSRGKIPKYRIPFVLFSIIQVVFDQKKIPTKNRIH